MVVFERPSGSGISETSAAEVVEVCDEARVVAALHAGRRQLILVVLRERSVDSNVFQFDNLFNFGVLIYHFSSPRGSFFEQSVVGEEDPDIVEHLVELARR